MFRNSRTHLLSRRSMLRWSGLTLGAAAVPILSACGAASPTATEKPISVAKDVSKAAEIVPTITPAQAATNVAKIDATKPAESAKPGAATKPADAAKPADATKPAAKPDAAKPDAKPAGPPTATPPPSQSVVQAVTALEKPKSSAKITDKLQILQNQDFHPDHNAFVRLMLEEWGKAQGWPMDISYISGFQGGSDLNQKLVAMVQSGTPPDVMDHNVDHRQQQFLGVLEPVTDLVQENEGKYGTSVFGIKRSANFEGEWWGVPYYTRAGGYYTRDDWFKEAGIDVDAGTETYNKMRETAMALSDPDKKRWGWGMTINRSGDGNGLVQNFVFAFGSRVQDEAGQVIVFNSPETVAGVEWLKETYTDPKWAKMLPPGVNAWNDISNNEAFLAGTLGITQNAGTMLAKAYFDKVPHAESIGQVQTPKSLDGKGPRLESGGGETLRVIKGTKNKDAAYDTIRFWTSLPVQQQIWRISTAYALPAYDKGWDDPIVANHKISRKFKAVVNNEDWWGLATPGPISPATGAIDQGNLFTDMMGEVLRGKPAAQAVEETHNRMVKIFKEFGLKGD